MRGHARCGQPVGYVLLLLLPTNVCLVSTFSSCLHCDVAIMAINFRGRADGGGEPDVGSYEDFFCYARAEYATPALIRKSA